MTKKPTLLAISADTIEKLDRKLGRVITAREHSQTLKEYFDGIHNMNNSDTAADHWDRYRGICKYLRALEYRITYKRRAIKKREE